MAFKHTISELQSHKTNRNHEMFQ